MEKFRYLTHSNKDAYFNLASEEYLLKHTNGYYVYLWINDSAVIVGINQNTIGEVNLNYCTEHGVKVVRRLTGGGAVYHDKNNVCYTVIAPYNENENNYVKFTKPVIEYLNTLGVKAEFSGRNDIVVDGQKISGNAQTVYGDRIMHHGTLLFDTDMSILSDALKENKLKTASKGIKSIRARVTNIKDHLKTPMTAEEFKTGLGEYLKKSCDEYSFNEKDIAEINKLVKEKYSTFEWNVGESPKGENLFSYKFPFGIFSIAFDTVDGRIKNPEVFGDFFSKKEIEGFSKSLDGVKWEKSEMYKAFKNIGEYIVNADGEEIVNKLFE